MDLVRAYIERIKEVNPHINAVVQDRFEGALEDAVRADGLIAKATDEQLPELFSRYSILGIPFTVKESCGLKGNNFLLKKNMLVVHLTKVKLLRDAKTCW